MIVAEKGERLLGDRAAFAREEAAALSLIRRFRVNPWELTYLAGTHAYRHETDRASPACGSRWRPAASSAATG